jgi:hypothetical protein
MRSVTSVKLQNKAHSGFQDDRSQAQLFVVHCSLAGMEDFSFHSCCKGEITSQVISAVHPHV